MKTIAVLGGIGPQATMDFERRVHEIAQGLLPRSGNKGYPPMVVYYHRGPPFLFDDDGEPVEPFRANPDFLEAARRLGAWADFMIIGANAAHRVQDEVETAAGVPVLSMIDVVMEEVERRGWVRAGVLAYLDASVYAVPLLQRGIAWESIDTDAQAQLDDLILEYQAGNITPESHAVVADALRTVRKRDVDGTILGCTELPLMLGHDAEAPDLVNPAQLLAEAAVRRAIA